MTACSEFCQRLKGIDFSRGVLLSHDELVQQLQFSDDDKELGRFLGVWHNLLERTQCEFCQLVVTAVSDSGSQAIEQNQPISVLIFPGEQCFRLSYPSRLGLRLVFIAEDAEGVTGPDTARPACEPIEQVSYIRSWLHTCYEEHQACSTFFGMPVSNAVRLKRLHFDFVMLLKL